MSKNNSRQKYEIRDCIYRVGFLSAIRRELQDIGTWTDQVTSSSSRDGFIAELGAKNNNILTDEISFIEKLSFNGFNEGTD